MSDITDIVVSSLRKHVGTVKGSLQNAKGLEAALVDAEEKAGVTVKDKDALEFFVDPDARSMVALIKKSGTEKTADHASYMRNRQKNLQRSRRYRMSHMAQIRKRARIYRKKIARHQIRARKRIGSRGGGYSFVAR